MGEKSLMTKFMEIFDALAYSRNEVREEDLIRELSVIGHFKDDVIRPSIRRALELGLIIENHTYSKARRP